MSLIPGKITLRFLSEPGDVNYGGMVHGGAVMKWIDQAGYSCASAWCQQYCVTVYVGGIRFIKPILIGDMVRIDAQLIHTGNTSMHIAIDVWSKKVTANTYEKKTHCIIVFVALDAHGKKTKVPNWSPTTNAQEMMQSYATKLMNLRKEIEDEMMPYFDKGK